MIIDQPEGRKLTIRAIVEFNEQGYLVYADDYIGAFARGKTKDEALDKLKSEVNSYRLWLSNQLIVDDYTIEIVQEEKSGADIADADTEIIFDSEKTYFTQAEYDKTKLLVIKSAKDFKIIYDSIPDVNQTTILPRKTFYGTIPCTPKEMLIHTNEVTKSYVYGLAEIENIPDIYLNRIAAFKQIEQQPNYLDNKVYIGIYGEPWSLKKAMRRFIWHDRIHAKALYRMATGLWSTRINNPFHFSK